MPKLCVMVPDNIIHDHTLGAKSHRSTVSQPQARKISREFAVGNIDRDDDERFKFTGVVAIPSIIFFPDKRFIIFILYTRDKHAPCGVNLVQFSIFLNGNLLLVTIKNRLVLFLMETYFSDHRICLS